MKIQINTGGNCWMTVKNAKALADYFTSGNYYRQALKAVKNRENLFRGYRLRYIEDQK